VMIGDTSFVMQMAQAAGVDGIGASWGYHNRVALQQARHVVDDFDQLTDLLNSKWDQDIE